MPTCQVQSPLIDLCKHHSALVCYRGGMVCLIYGVSQPDNWSLLENANSLLQGLKPLFPTHHIQLPVQILQKQDCRAGDLGALFPKVAIQCLVTNDLCFPWPGRQSCEIAFCPRKLSFWQELRKFPDPCGRVALHLKLFLPQVTSVINLNFRCIFQVFFVP